MIPLEIACMLEQDVSLSGAPARAIVRLRAWQAQDLVSLPATLAPIVRLLSLGPREWWAVSQSMKGPVLASRLTLDREGLIAVDLSSSLKILRIKGRAASDLLSKSCGLDLDRFERCTRTRLAQVPVVVDRVDTTFELYVERSYFSYLEACLRDAALEYRPNNDHTAESRI
jgi:heterotetrameric sarcosine oxidase gamma subunit